MILKFWDGKMGIVYRIDWVRIVWWLVMLYEVRMMFRLMSNYSKVWGMKVIKLRFIDILYILWIYL